jgi:hypothetical protein
VPTMTVHDDWVRFDEKTNALYGGWDPDMLHPFCPLYPADETETSWVYEYEFTFKEGLIRSLKAYSFWGIVFVVGTVFVVGGLK